MREQNSGPTALWSPLKNALRMADFLDILTLLRQVQSDLSTTILFLMGWNASLSLFGIELDTLVQFKLYISFWFLSFLLHIVR